VWTLVQPAAASAHLALAAALWGTLVVVTLHAQRAALAEPAAPVTDRTERARARRAVAPEGAVEPARGRS
jgi:hypothetical protein